MTVLDPVGVGPATPPARDRTEVEHGTAGGGTTVRVHGELLQETTPAFAAAVDDLATDATVADVVVDLSMTTFMDSTGLGALVTLHNRVVHRGGTVRLVRPDARVFRLFELTRLDTYFVFVDHA